MLWNYLSPENKEKLRTSQHPFTAQNVIDALKKKNYVIELTVLEAYDLLLLCDAKKGFEQIYVLLTDDYNEIE